MPCQNKIKILLLFVFSTYINISNAQICSGSWALQRPLSSFCASGQWVGWQNSGTPIGCPIIPNYVGVQSNTFNFSNSVNFFSIDFAGFDGMPLCARIEIKVNGVFFPLQGINVSAIPGCTNGSFSYLALTNDGYLTISNLGGSGLSGTARITINHPNTSSVTVSTNDGSGTTFSNPFNCTVVPLTLEKFEGSTKYCKLKLNWATGIEDNVKYIKIEKSEDGNTFFTIGEIIPKGSNSLYSFTSNNLSDAYLRLKIIDFDNTFKYSDIIYLKSSCDKAIYKISPNPAISKVEILGLAKKDWLKIFDISGRLFLSFKSLPNFILDVDVLIPGLYFVQIGEGNSVKANLKLIKK